MPTIRHLLNLTMGELPQNRIKRNGGKVKIFGARFQLIQIQAS